MARLTEGRKKELVEIRDTEGVLPCMDEVNLLNAEEILVCEGLNYDYYIDEAKAIQKELEKGFVDLAYLDEKMRHLKQFSRIVERRRARSPSWG